MKSENRPKERKSGKLLPVREAIISIVLTTLASVTVGVFSNFITNLFLFIDGVSINFLKEYASVIVIVVSLIGVVNVLTIVAVTYYQRKNSQTEVAIQKLHEKESVFFQDIELDLSSLLTEKVK